MSASETCLFVLEHLDAWIDDELAPAPAARLEGHLASCTACRAEAQALRSLDARLDRVHADLAPAPEIIAARVLDALPPAPTAGDAPVELARPARAPTRSEERRSRPSGLGGWFFAAAMATAAAAALLAASMASDPGGWSRPSPGLEAGGHLPGPSGPAPAIARGPRPLGPTGGGAAGDAASAAPHAEPTRAQVPEPLRAPVAGPRLAGSPSALPRPASSTGAAGPARPSAAGALALALFAGEVLAARGDVSVEAPRSASAQGCDSGDRLPTGCRFTTGESALASVALTAGARIRCNEQTRLVVASSDSVELLSGELEATAPPATTLTIATAEDRIVLAPGASARVRLRASGTLWTVTDGAADLACRTAGDSVLERRLEPGWEARRLPPMKMVKGPPLTIRETPTAPPAAPWVVACERNEGSVARDRVLAYLEAFARPGDPPDPAATVLPLGARAFAPLREFVARRRTDDSPRPPAVVRAEAARLLARLSTTTADALALSELLQDREPGVRTAAFDRLGELVPWATAGVARRVFGEGGNMKLAWGPAERIREAIERRLRDPDGGNPDPDERY